MDRVEIPASKFHETPQGDRNGKYSGQYSTGNSTGIVRGNNSIPPRVRDSVELGSGKTNASQFAARPVIPELEALMVVSAL